MEMLNKIELQGIVGAVRKENVNGKQYAMFSLVTEYSYKGKDGCMVIETTWHNVYAFESDRCVNIASIIKGCELYVLGRLRCRRYTDSDGSTRQCVEVIAQEVNILN